MTMTEKDPDAFEKISSEIIKAIRGDSTVSQFSKHLGFEFNQVAKWESGEKRILWTDLVNIAKICKLPLRESLQNASFSGADLPEVNAGILLHELKGEISTPEFARRLGYSRLKLHRWLSGEIAIPLADFLRILNLVRGNALFFIEGLVGANRVPTALEDFSSQRAYNQLLREKPWTAFMLRLLKHKDCPGPQGIVSFLAAKLGVTEETVESTLKLLLDIGMVSRNKEGRYKLEVRRMVADRETNSIYTSYWFNTGAEFYNTLARKYKGTTADNRLGSIVFSVDDDSWLKIQTLYQTFFENLVAIINSDEGEQTKFKAINLQIFDLEQAGTTVDLTKSALSKPK
jgi:DNA-binding transcriptional regulator YiaG/DNA-binding transcriptional ArsR family regulator